MSERWKAFDPCGRSQFLRGLEDTAQNRKLAAEMEAAHRRLREGALGIQKIEARAFCDAIDEFVEHEKLARKDKENTWRRIKTTSASLKAFFGKKTVYLISQSDVEKYKLWRLNGDDSTAPVKAITVRHDLDSLSLFLQWAQQANYVRKNLVEEIKKPAEDGTERMYILSLDEERRYFEFLRSQSISENGNLHDVGRLMINQGFRPDEAMALEKAAVDLDNKVVRVTKSKTKKGLRSLKLTAESWQILARRMAGDSRWIFPSTRRSGHHITKLNCPHDRALAKLGINFVLYDLRHTFATRMIEAGIDLPTLRDIMGHKDIRTTMRYVHVTNDHQHRAMEKFEAERLRIEKQFEESQMRKNAASDHSISVERPN